MPVNSKHPKFVRRERDYSLIADCLEGQRRIKAEGERYLPKPNASDESPENEERYKAYKRRAVFHNATARTVANMIGQSFAVAPVPTMPEQMLPWLEDIDGAGVTADQQSKQALAYVMAFSRAFLWVDYPKTGGVVSLKDAEEGRIRPRIILVDPRKVINWRVTQQGAKSLLSLVVIEEEYIKKDDGFEAEYDTQYRVLKLQGGIYMIQVWRATPTGWGIHEQLVPGGGDGQPLKEIPAIFLGAEANDTEVEKPLMLDIANLNVAHYRNSADYEEAVYMLGQPTTYLTGLTDAWIDKHMPKGIFLGSREVIPLPTEGNAGVLQVAPNTLPKEAMDQKEALMTALGAKLVEKTEVQKTATESSINEASETSILASACNNVSEGYGAMLRHAAHFGNVSFAEDDPDAILYELNTDFAIARMSPEEAAKVLELFNGQLITFEEARDKLKTGGWAYLDDEDAKDQLEEKAEEDFKKAQDELTSQTNEQIRVQEAKTKTTPPAAK